MSDLGEVTDFESDGPFPAESSEAIHGLLSLGHLSKDVSYAGHQFAMRTLRSGEEIAVGQVTKDYADTVGYAKAYAIAIVAASLDMVDHAPMFQALGPDMKLPIQQKFGTIAQWFWPVVEHLYNEYLTLLEAQIAAFEALQVKS